MSSFASSLRSEDKDQGIAKNFKLVLDNLLAFPEDYGLVFEEFSKTFKRKRYAWLFVDASVIAFSLLKDF